MNCPLFIEIIIIYSEMERIVLYRILRPDKTIFAIKDFVSKHLGKEFIEIPALNMAASFAESSKTTPLILVLSPGCDPLASLHNFTPENADQRPTEVRILSLGQGQVSSISNTRDWCKKKSHSYDF